MKKFSKLFTILGGMLLFIILGYVCEPILMPEKKEQLVIKDTKTEEKAPEQTDIVVKDDTPEPVIDDTKDSSGAFEIAEDDSSESVLDTWGNDGPSEAAIAEQNQDINNYEPDDTELIVVKKVEEDAEVPLDPKQQYVSPLLTGTRKVHIKSGTKKIARSLASEDNKPFRTEEFPPEAWVRPAEIRKTLTERCISRLGKLSTDEIWTLMQNDSARHDVSILQMIRLVGEDTIKSIAKKHAGRLTIATMCSDSRWLNGFLYSGPTENMDAALINLAYIFTKYAEYVEDPMAQKIATAGALEFARSGYSAADLLDRFSYFFNSYNEKKLNVLFENLQFWDMRLVLGAKQPEKWGSVKNLTWLRDNVCLPEQMYTGACSQVPYRLRNYAGDSIHGAEYLRCFLPYFDNVLAHAHREIGGVCGALSHYGTYAAIAAGIPAITMGEPGHCAYTVRVQGEWIRCNSIYPQRSLHLSFWKEPAWDYLDLMQTIYTDRHTTMASDQMLALADLLIEQRKQLAAFYCFENALVAQPGNFPAIIRYNAFLKDRGSDKLPKLLELHDLVIDGICATHHNAGSRLLSKYIYPVLLPQIPDKRERTKLFAAFFKQCKTMGSNPWDVAPLLNEQIKSFETPKEQIAFMKESLRDLIATKDYSATAMAWGLEFLSTIPDSEENAVLKEDFTEAIIKALSLARTSKNDKDSTWKALGSALFTAAENKERAVFSAIGKLAYRKCKRDFPKNKFKFKAFRGSLISETALIYSDFVLSSTDQCCLHWAALQKEGGAIKGKSSVTVEMEKSGIINGIVVITSQPLDASREMIFEISNDGQNWQQIGTASIEGNIISCDTSKYNAQARCVRMRRGDTMIASDMTTGIPVSAFYVYGKIPK